MLYQLGKILKFNNAEWGFMDFKSDRLTVYSLSDKKKVAFKLSQAKFDEIYTKSSKNGVSQETIDFSFEEEKAKAKLIKSLKPGVVFEGDDGGTYTISKFDKKAEKIEFYEGDDSYSAGLGFIKSLTDKFNESYVKFMTPVKLKKEYNALTNEEKVQIAVNECRDAYKYSNLEILEIGDIISGEAFYHEEDDYYNLIGLQIKFKYRFDFQDKDSIDVGFFPIYIGRIKNYYPTVFSESYSTELDNIHHYCNGLGDEIEIYEKLVDKSKLKDIKFI